MLRIPPPPARVPAEDVVLAVGDGLVVLLAGEAEGLVAGGAGAVGEDAAVGLVLGAPVDGAGGVALDLRGAEVVGEGPVRGARRRVDLGHRGAGEPDVF